MKCAKCEDQMETMSLSGIEVEQCKSCSGIWFDFNELEEVLTLSNIDTLKNKIENNEGHDDIKAQCPKCAGAGNMVQVVDPQHGIKIDTCSVCSGRWLDGGELEKLKDDSILKSIISFFK